MKTVQQRSPRGALRLALEKMLPSIELAFAQGRIRTESDLNYAIVSYLQNELSPPTTRSGWIVGANHLLFGVRPDVACYLVDRPFVEFLKNPQKCVVGVMEIKFASNIKDDLDKLTRIQRKRDVLAWMVYGDHFCEDIHRNYCRAHLRREKKIHDWSMSHKYRGHSILKCGQLHEKDGLGGHEDVILAFNSHWWIRDDD